MAAATPRLTRTPGLYLLGLALAQPVRLAVGALGLWELPAGLYGYVGSAWGPGGLAARVERHWRGAAVSHWHVDALRAVATPVALWIAPGARDECGRARQLLAQPFARLVIPRFGASDCHCPAHLSGLGPLPESWPALEAFAGAAGWQRVV